MRTIVFCPSFERGILFMYLLSISVVRLTGLRGEQGRVQFGVDNPGFTFPGFPFPPFPSSESVSYLMILTHKQPQVGPL